MPKIPLYIRLRFNTSSTYIDIYHKKNDNIFVVIPKAF